jgi:hypothetical protein
MVGARLAGGDQRRPEAGSSMVTAVHVASTVVLSVLGGSFNEMRHIYGVNISVCCD